MYIGVPKERKSGEGRVGLTPNAVKQLIALGHPVCVEADAGILSGFTNEAYVQAGAVVTWDTSFLYRYAEMIVKVKELTPPEYKYIEHCADKIFATYWHLAGGDSELTKALLRHRVSAWAYECVEREEGMLVKHPLLDPMSTIAGREAMHAALLYGIHSPALEMTLPIVIVGGGTVGVAALEKALSSKLRSVTATLFEKDPKRYSLLAHEYKGRADIRLMSDDRSEYREALSCARVVILAVMATGGARAPIVITKDDLTYMQNGCYIADVAIDQGGSTAVSRPTKPGEIFEHNGIIFSCVPNIPGSTVPREATEALVAATLPYLTALAQKGLWWAMKESTGTYKGLQTFNGWILNKHVVAVHSLEKEYRSFDGIF